MKIPKFFGLHAQPSGAQKWTLAIIPFVILIGVYMAGSYIRLSENPQDKLMPTVASMVESVDRLAFTENRRTGEYVMLQDTLSSLTRIGIGVTLSAIVGFYVGVKMGLFPGWEALLLKIVTFMSIIPPLAIMPILIIAFGVGEVGKVVLIFIGTVFLITRDIHLATKALPKELIIKVLTLGASEFQVMYTIVMPQILPRLIDSVRLSLGAAWLFLIASEGLAASSGLGYRIFLMTRFMDMSTIIPYVAWMTFIGFSIDWILRQIIMRRFAWYVVGK